MSAEDKRCTTNLDKDRAKSQDYYKRNSEQQKAKAKDHSQRSYESDPEPKRAQAKDQSQRSYESDPEPQKERSRRSYESDPEPKRKRMREVYENITSQEALNEFRCRAVYGPIFLCLYCAEFQFKSNVERVMDQAVRSEFMDKSYISRHAPRFKVLESHWACHVCLNQVVNGKIPARSTANIFPDETPERFKDITDIENSLAAPVIVFVKLHNLKNHIKNTKKIVACPVSTDKVFENLRGLRRDVDMATLMRSVEYDRKVYQGQLRPSLVRELIMYLISVGYPHYGCEQNALALAGQINRLDLSTEFEQSPDNFLASREEEEEEDAVERQRVKLDCVATAFLPNSDSVKFAPAADAEVLNMTTLRNPYSQMFPPRFPSGLDIHQDFTRPVTESEWVNHKIRGIDHWFSTNPLFIFTAAYRLDFQKISSSLHAVKGKTFVQMDHA